MDAPGERGFTIVVVIVTIASLILAWRAGGPLRAWWLAAAGTALADRLFTFGYFIPTMVRLMNTADSPASRSAAAQWATIDWVRHGIVLIAWLLAMKAFALVHTTRS